MVKGKRILTITVAFLLIWQGLVMFGGYPKALLPYPADVAKVFIEEVISGQLVLAIFYSIRVITIALIWALLLSAMLTILSQFKPWGESLVDFLVTLAHPLPGIAILPLVILWFGIGEKALLFVIVHSMVWPLVITLRDRMGTLQHQYLRVAKAYNFSMTKKYIHLYGMGCIPAFITGAKIAWSRGWRAFISAEMVFGIVGQKSGLGWYLFEQRVYFNSEKLFAGLLAVIVCGVVIEQLVFKPLEEGVGERWR